MDLQYIKQFPPKALLVNGKRFDLDDGIIKGLTNAEAKDLLKARNTWKILGAKSNIEPEPEAKPKADLEVEPVEAVANSSDNEVEWPDPDASMKKSYLKEMADAYGVKYPDNISKKDLVELISAEMYE